MSGGSGRRQRSQRGAALQARVLNKFQLDYEQEPTAFVAGQFASSSGSGGGGSKRSGRRKQHQQSSGNNLIKLPEYSTATTSNKDKPVGAVAPLPKQVAAHENEPGRMLSSQYQQLSPLASSYRNNSGGSTKQHQLFHRIIKTPSPSSNSDDIKDPSVQNEPLNLKIGESPIPDNRRQVYAVANKPDNNATAATTAVSVVSSPTSWVQQRSEKVAAISPQPPPPPSSASSSASNKLNDEATSDPNRSLSSVPSVAADDVASSSSTQSGFVLNSRSFSDVNGASSSSSSSLSSTPTSNKRKSSSNLINTKRRRRSTAHNKKKATTTTTSPPCDSHVVTSLPSSATSSQEVSVGTNNNGWKLCGELYKAQVYNPKLDKYTEESCYPMIMRRTDDEDDKGGDTSTDDENEEEEEDEGGKTSKYNLSVIAVHDCVFVNAGDEEPYVAQVRAIYVDDHHKIHLSVIWFYRYSHMEPRCQSASIKDKINTSVENHQPMPGGIHKSEVGEDELFLSRHEDTIIPAMVDDRCYVLHETHYYRVRARMARWKHGRDSNHNDVHQMVPLKGSPLGVRRRFVGEAPVSRSNIFFFRLCYDIKTHRVAVPPRAFLGKYRSTEKTKRRRNTLKNN